MATRVSFNFQDAQECADDFLAAGLVCGGCRWYSHCGIAERDNRALRALLYDVDSDRTRVSLVPLAQIGGEHA